MKKMIKNGLIAGPAIALFLALAAITLIRPSATHPGLLMGHETLNMEHGTNTANTGIGLNAPETVVAPGNLSPPDAGQASVVAVPTMNVTDNQPPAVAQNDMTPKNNEQNDASSQNAATTPVTTTRTDSGAGTIKSVRIDLSSMPAPGDMEKLAVDMVNRLSDAGANTAFLSPWSDGYADYKSAVAPQNAYGQNGFVENFLSGAHAAGIKVYAWFVTGKDDFPYFSRPEWFARTVAGVDYYQADEPGVNLPFASLANDQYIDYHLQLIKEAGSLGFDGYVISEPLIGWGDRYDPYYTDFSPSATAKFESEYQVDPRDIFDENSSYYYEDNPAIYNDWVNFRAGVVTNFTAKTMAAIRAVSDKPVVITLYTEPGPDGRLMPFSGLKDWLGEDIPALAALKPDAFEIQDLFTDFDHPQPPDWVVSMVAQFKSQLGADIPVMVSVQGFQGAEPLTSSGFAAAVKAATADPDVTGVSFYAYHTLDDSFWSALKGAWK